MGDLISRESVIDLLSELRIDNIAVNGKRITEHIEELPTAYNLDAVVEQLEYNRDEFDRRGIVPLVNMDYAVDIVRNGGKE